MHWHAIHRCRAQAAAGVRALGAVSIAGGVYLILKKLLFAIGTRQPDMILDIYTEIGQTQDTYRGLSLLAVGVALALSATRLARWILAVPAAGCPRCAYATAPSAPSCPECGLTDPTDIAAPAPQEPALSWRPR